MADDRKPRKDPTAIDDGKLKLYAEPLKQDGTARSPSLRVKMIENNPCIHVDLGIKTEGRNGKEGYPISIETPMEPRSFYTLMSLIDEVAAYKGECAFEMDNWGHPFMWDRDQGKNVRSKERLIISRFQIAKRADGLVTFGVTAKGKNDVTFEFKPNEFHPVMQNGQAVPVQISSRLAAQSWARVWKDVYLQHFERKWEEPAFLKQRRLENMQRASGGSGGSQGNYNNQQQRPQQNSYSAPASAPSAPAGGDDFGGEDIPF